MRDENENRKKTDDRPSDPICPKCGGGAREGICDRCDRFLRPRVKRSDKNYWQAKISYEIAKKKADKRHLTEKRWNPVLGGHYSNEELVQILKEKKSTTEEVKK